MNQGDNNLRTAKSSTLLRRWRYFALAVGLGGTIASVGAAFVATDQFWKAYLVGFLFWWQISVGFLGLSLLRCVVRSNWGDATWPYLKASLVTVPLSAIFFAPIAANLSHVFPWAAQAHADAVSTRPVEATQDSDDEHTADHASGHINDFQTAYFDHNFFWGRSVGYFVVWLGACMIAGRSGTVTGDSRRPRRLPAFALIGLVLTATFAAFDWGMSLEPQWYSTIYGAMILISGAVGALAVLILSWALLLQIPRVSGLRLRAVSADLGNLLLAFLMIWSYFAFSQYLIIWAGNLPAEVTWYVRRGTGSWQVVLLAIVALHFVIPFFALVSRERKQNPRRLGRIAGLLLAANLLQTIWTYAPSFANDVNSLHWSLLASLFAVGGWWAFAYTTALSGSLRDEKLMRPIVNE